MASITSNFINFPQGGADYFLPLGTAQDLNPLSNLSVRYDAFLYTDETSALHPLGVHPHGQLLPETYPFGI